MSSTQHKEEGNQTKLIVSGLASAGFILLFVLILWLTYLPTHSDEVDADLRAERETKLAELKSEAESKIESYAVVNPNDGVYRIPVEVAMERTVAEYKEQ